MGQYVVIHMEKRKEVSAVLERHILRQEVKYENGEKLTCPWTPANANEERMALNRELVTRKYIDPETKKQRELTISQAVRKRIREAGIEKIRPNQNIALEIIFTGSPETMNALGVKELGEWAERTLAWAGKQWGRENIVSAVLHCDEKTPHIHLILVPIVQGVSRRSISRDRARARTGKNSKLRNRNLCGNRLCANEVYTQPRLWGYHTSYAEEVGIRFGLSRGVRGEKGSRRSHSKSEEHNRRLERQAEEQIALIAELTAEYSDKKEILQQIEQKIASANDSQKAAEEFAAGEEERRLKAEIEADNEEHRLKEYRRKNEIVLERGKELEQSIREREDYLRSLSGKNLFEFIRTIPQLIKKELTSIVNKYLKGEVESYQERYISIDCGESQESQKFYEMGMKKEDGHNYSLAVSEKDARAWVNSKPYLRKNGEALYMPEIVDFFTQNLTPEGKELVTSLYRSEVVDCTNDRLAARIKERYGEDSIRLVTSLRTNGKETGRMYHLLISGKKMTLVTDYEAKEQCKCLGHAKKGALYLSRWTTMKGEPAVAVKNRVISLNFKKKQYGMGI